MRSDNAIAEERTSDAPISLKERIATARRHRDQLLQQRELQRIQEEIAILENSRGRPDESIEGEDTASASITTPSTSDRRTRKRRRDSDSDDERPRRKKSIKPKDPTPYSGASLRQYRNYVRDCELAMKNSLDSFPTEEDLIT